MEQGISQHQQALNAAARESSHKGRIAAAYAEMEREDGFAQSDARILPQLSFMEDQLSKTMALLRELEERLEPILLPSYPSPSDGAINAIPHKEGSAISLLIDQRNSDLSEIQRRIREMEARVQL